MENTNPTTIETLRVITSRQRLMTNNERCRRMMTNDAKCLNLTYTPSVIVHMLSDFGTSSFHLNCVLPFTNETCKNGCRKLIYQHCTPSIGLQIAWSRWFDSLEIQSDCMNAANHVTGPNVASLPLAVVRAIARLRERAWLTDVRWISRTTNKPADLLAKLADPTHTTPPPS
ncbi:hypothetical protein V6N12_066328 [Hibiscus sabdariffa]|uniref:RNase H type-1 domain-containing protein n=1 Tax=Hibiscus sabdariffa TaxID=183260 RepID=A0ABR2CPS3_9ROSI